MDKLAFWDEQFSGFPSIPALTWHEKGLDILEQLRCKQMSGSPQAARLYIQVHSCQVPLVYGRNHIRLHYQQKNVLLQMP